jgi:hypothetical protein
MIREQSPTIVKPLELGLAWTVAAVPLVALLVLAGRFLDSRLGPVAFAPGGDEEDLVPLEDDFA